MDELFSKLFSENLKCHRPSPFLSMKEGSHRELFYISVMESTLVRGNDFTFNFMLQFGVKLNITPFL